MGTDESSRDAIELAKNVLFLAPDVRVTIDHSGLKVARESTGFPLLVPLRDLERMVNRW